MITALAEERCELGESPLWNPHDGSLYWTDIPRGQLYRYEMGRCRCEVIYKGESVGGLTLQEDGSLLLFRVNDIALLPPGGEVQVLRHFRDPGSERFNDVIADPEGRVFAGTIGRTSTSGGLFRIDPDGSITLLFRGTGVANGMGFSPDCRTFYWTCSTRRKIFAFDYDRTSGSLHNERVWYTARPDEGIPDGLAVDQKGDVWSARWDGSAVAHHASDGNLLEYVKLPARNVTSVCFGGPELREMFITTAGGALGSQREEGAVFRYPAPAGGVPRFASAVTAREQVNHEPIEKD
ncbi:MAG: SMP-30/gluconolactonase/LRE family protein [Verrucomicrobiaceae bacterium]|nr:MAG: SMP-30/gluconolactonase/LRE family protein [Verrucomicrobiaceae bacterium]